MVFQMAFSVLLPLPLFPLYPSLPFLPLYLTLVLVFSFVSPQHELYFFFLRRSSHPVWSLTRYLTPVVIWIVGHISKAWMIASTRKRKHMTFVLGALGPLTQDYFFSISIHLLANVLILLSLTAGTTLNCVDIHPFHHVVICWAMSWPVPISDYYKQSSNEHGWASVSR